jgi:hypothetical protein
MALNETTTCNFGLFEGASEKGAFSSVQEVNRNREKINSKA